jgi:hypothetical protein
MACRWRQETNARLGISLTVIDIIDPHRPFAGVPFLAGAGGFRSCSDIFSAAGISTPIVLSWSPVS